LGAEVEPVARVDDGRQEIISECNLACRILCDGPAFSHDQRQRLAHVAKLVIGEIARIDMKPDRGHRERERHPVACQMRTQVAIGENRPHARHGARLICIDASEARVRHRATDKARMQEPGQGDVVDEAASTAQERVVLVGA
jgi:hypothetical protein